jgi:hypothetical protein
MWTWVGVGMLWVLQSGLLDIARLFKMHCQLVYCRLVKIPLPHIKNYRDLQFPKSQKLPIPYILWWLGILHAFAKSFATTLHNTKPCGKLCITRKCHWQHAHPNGRGRENQFQQNNVLTQVFWECKQLVATDHCPFNSKQKALGKHDFRKIPNGVNGTWLLVQNFLVNQNCTISDMLFHLFCCVLFCFVFSQ